MINVLNSMLADNNQSLRSHNSYWRRLSCLLLAFFNICAIKTQAATVGQWDRFECSVPNTTSYKDPHRDVTLNATFTRPDGSTVGFWGFYDGGTTWRIRFMPDQLGTWTYMATFSDNSPGVSGTFNCIESDNTIFHYQC